MSHTFSSFALVLKNAFFRLWAGQGLDVTTPMLTLDEVGNLLSISRSTVLRLIENQELDVTRIGRSVRVSEDSLDRYVDAHTDYGHHTRESS